MYEIHKWNNEFCSCGQDTVVCQKCGKSVCANVGIRKDEKNYCVRCATVYNIGFANPVFLHFRIRTRGNKDTGSKDIG